MRLGFATLPPWRKGPKPTLKLYGSDTIHERHRHRYEVNNNLRPKLKSGLKVSGLSADKKLVEMIENPNHPWFVETLMSKIVKVLGREIIDSRGNPTVETKFI